MEVALYEQNEYVLYVCVEGCVRCNKGDIRSCRSYCFKPPRYCSDSRHRGLMESNQPTTVNIFIPCNSHKSLTKDAISQLSSLLTRFEIIGDCSRHTLSGFSSLQSDGECTCIRSTYVVLHRRDNLAP